MVDTNSPEWEIHYSNVMRRSRRRLEQMLDRFGESLQGWLSAALNWPQEDWEADLADFLAHSRMTGIELSDESLGQIRGLIESRVNGTGVFAEQTFSDGSLKPIRNLTDANANGTGAFAAPVDSESKPKNRAVQLAAVMIAPDSGTDATVDLSEGPKEEVAGPGPETSDSFKGAVQAILGLIDPFVAGVWEDSGGLVRSRTRKFYQIRSGYYLERDNGRPVIVVLEWFTANDVAMAILKSAYDRKANPIRAEVVETKILTSKEIEKRFAELQTEAFKQAAAEAASIAGLYYGMIASLTPAGELVVTIDDGNRNGFNWNHLLSALPLLAVFRKVIKRLVIKLPGGKIFQISTELLQKLYRFGRENAKKLIAKARKGATEKESLAIIEKGLEASLEVNPATSPIPLNPGVGALDKIPGPSDLVELGGAPATRDLTKAGHSLAKHEAGKRTGSSVFPRASGGPKDINKQALDLLNDIVNDPARVVKQRPGRPGEQLLQIHRPDGSGVIFKRNGSQWEFSHFAENLF